MPARAAAKPRFYFNLRSPYNFFALHDLAARYPEVLDRVEWRPFWEPDEASAKGLAEAGGEFPYTPMSRAKQFYILRDVKRLAADRGLAVSWPVDREPWWEPAHLTWFLAERQGLGRAWVERAGRARWLEGRDICDLATVVELAASIGLDPDAVAAGPDDPELREQAVRALLDVHREGVFGVPYFVDGREPYWGLDRVPAFVAALEAGGTLAPAAERQPGAGPNPALVAGPASELSHAGGCG
ncbi:2-hydroxychromene-2-carboxylate isomerase [Streptacidiphilus sp. MAP12-33]|uniref:2-hydroxychromene-2-carboxylate isomerase n=1 Tax=Streptacidiphilus sp. MAP12-33 TaxID=3156266 RepID=UPI00351236C6